MIRERTDADLRIRLEGQLEFEEQFDAGAPETIGGLSRVTKKTRRVATRRLQAIGLEPTPSAPTGELIALLRAEVPYTPRTLLHEGQEAPPPTKDHHLNSGP